MQVQKSLNDTHRPEILKACQEAQKINLAPCVYKKIALKGITRPIVSGVVIHGQRIENHPNYYTAFLLLGYIVILRKKRVITAYFDESRV